MRAARVSRLGLGPRENLDVLRRRRMVFSTPQKFINSRCDLTARWSDLPIVDNRGFHAARITWSQASISELGFLVPCSSKFPR